MTTKASPATLSSVQWTFPTVAAMQAAAVTGGLAVGVLYKTSTGEVRIRV